MCIRDRDKVVTEVVEKKAEQQIRVEMNTTEDGAYTAIVTSTVEENGKISETVKEFTAASKEGIKAQVEVYNSAISIE